jgi:predicted ester cyclase
MVAAQWMMRGTHTGSLFGGPPTGRKIALPGADFITVEGDRIRSVRGYFDRKDIADQLGFQDAH